MSLSDFLYSELYPKLNAVDSGLLDSLNPTAQPSGAGVYYLDCPACNKRREGYYYTGSSHINCNRKEKCGASTSIWDVLQAEGLAGKEILRTLCDAAGVNPPTQEKGGQNHRAGNLSDLFKRVTRDLLKTHPEVKNEYMSERNLSAEDMATLDYGYYPSKEIITEKLKEAGADLAEAESAGLLDYRFNQRILGFWDQPDGSSRPWGRLLNKDLATLQEKYPNIKKYHFCSGFTKTRPYKFSRGKGMVYGVEGTTDADSLILMEFTPAMGFGQALVNSAQANFLAEKGVTELLFLVDGGTAGYTNSLKTIRNCEPLGITTRFGIIPESLDDVDKLRQTGRQDLVQQVIDNAINSGELLARLLCKAIDEPGTTGEISSDRIWGMRSFLTPDSAALFDRALSRMDIKANVDVSALQMYQNLLEAGIAHTECQKRVMQRYNIDIQFKHSGGSYSE